MNKQCSICPRGAVGSVKGKRLCPGHWRRAMGLIPSDRPIEERQRQGPCCVVVDCQEKPKAKGLCGFHYQRRREGRDVLSGPKREKLRGRHVINVAMSDLGLNALDRRCVASGITRSALIRAIVERWAQTDGAQMQRTEIDAEEEAAAWRRSDFDMRGEA